MILGGISIVVVGPLRGPQGSRRGNAGFRSANLSDGDGLLELMNSVAHDYRRIDGTFNNGRTSTCLIVTVMFSVPIPRFSRSR